MRLILRQMGVYAHRIALSMSIKLLGAMTELMIPYILEHLIDEVVPLGKLSLVLLWSTLMIATAILTRQLNVWANRIAIDNAQYHSTMHSIHTRLSAFEWQVLQLVLDGYGHAEISARLGCSRKAAENAMQRVRRKLRDDELA